MQRQSFFACAAANVLIITSGQWRSMGSSRLAILWRELRQSCPWDVQFIGELM